MSSFETVWKTAGTFKIDRQTVFCKKFHSSLVTFPVSVTPDGDRGLDIGNKGDDGVLSKHYYYVTNGTGNGR